MVARRPGIVFGPFLAAGLWLPAAQGETVAEQDPASLSRLHDIVMPAPVDLWWPPATGWYVLAALVIVSVSWGLRRIRQQRQAARYRVEALKELRALRQSPQRPRTDAAGLLILLKRTALAAYPRTRVASLHGASWWIFLDQSCGRTLFADGLGDMVEQLAYSARDGEEVSARDLRRIYKAAGKWIKGHRPADALHGPDGGVFTGAPRDVED